jgi:hypothetical protein
MIISKCRAASKRPADMEAIRGRDEGLKKGLVWV